MADVSYMGHIIWPIVYGPWTVMHGGSNNTFSILYSELPSMKELPPLPSRITNRPGYSNSDLNQIDINIMVDSSKPQARPTSRFGYDFVEAYHMFNGIL